MAIISADFQFNIDEIDLNYFIQNLSTDEFNDNINNAYEDNYHLITTTDDALSLYGSGFAYDGSNNMVSGTVEAMSQWYWGGTAWVGLFHISGLSVSMADIYAAANTSSTADDYALVKSGLSGRDRFYLSSGNDKAHGYGGADLLKGFGGRDVLYGDRGKDVLIGGAGRDKMFAGNDNNVDRFVFKKIGDSHTGSARDKIFQFDHGEDLIDLSGIDANIDVNRNQAFVFSGAGAHANAVWVEDTGSNLIIKGDVDGDAVADFAIELVNVDFINAGDFIL